VKLAHLGTSEAKCLNKLHFLGMHKAFSKATLSLLFVSLD